MNLFLRAPPDLSPHQLAAWRVSLLLTLLRLALAPTFALAGYLHANPWLLSGLLLTGLLSDLFDGRVLRRAGVVAPGLRTIDSAVDTLFFLGAAFAAWEVQREIIVRFLPMIGAVFALEVCNNLFGLLKYRRTPSYHARSARTFSVLLLVTLTLLFARGSDALMAFTLLVGLIAQLETLCITLVLPRWTNDVPSLRHALRLRDAWRTMPAS